MTIASFYWVWLDRTQIYYILYFVAIVGVWWHKWYRTGGSPLGNREGTKAYFTFTDPLSNAGLRGEGEEWGDRRHKIT